MLHAHCVSSTTPFSSPSSPSSFLSLVLPSARQLHLPGCGGQIPCAHPPMRTLALLPSTTLSQVMSPTTTTSRRLIDHTPRNPRSSSGPRMTSTTMTSPSARRSLMRAVDEPITLKKKVCRLVCRHLTHKFRVFKKFRDTALKVSRLGLSWSDKESRVSLTVKQRFENTNSRQIMTEEVFKS